MLGMFALGVSFLYGVAIGTSIAVAFTVVAALTLLPALLGFFGTRVLRRRERRALREGKLRTSDESAGWARWAGWMQKRPALFAAVAAGVSCCSRFRSSRCDSARPTRGLTRPARPPVRRMTCSRRASAPATTARSSSWRRCRVLRRRRSSIASSAPWPRLLALSDPAPAVHPRPGPGGCPVRGSPMSTRRGRRRTPRRPICCTHVRGQVVPAAERGTGLHVLVGGQTAIFDDFAAVLSRKLPLLLWRS